ncbi:MAG: toll/interleukin-1 receptor domain-containing protein [Chitinophagaceae bacterium]
MKYDVFISHSAKDKNFVLKLAKDLMANGVNVWLDEWNLSVGDTFANTINQAVINARFVLIIMSPDYFTSNWTHQELNLAMDKEINERVIKTIPILYRDCSIPNILRTKLYADFRNQEEYQVQLSKLVRDLLLIDKEKISSSYTDDNKDKEDIAGVNIENIGKDKLDEIKDMLKEAVNAFKVQPEIKVKEVEVEGTLCFIVMPFGNENLDVVYEDFIKPSIENSCNLVCERGDDVFGSNIIMEDISRSIKRARLIVADLTGRNPNVFYEVGIAHTLNKSVLLLAQNVDDVPFDLRHRRVLIYDYSPKGCKKLEKDIVKSVNSILS